VRELFDLNLTGNLKAFIQILDPDNEYKIKDSETALKFINDICRRNEHRYKNNILDSIPVFTF